jgi:hypothetical protein
MTLEETGAIMDILRAAYPNFYKSQSADERLGAADLWAAMFGEDDFAIVACSVKAFIATDPKGFPPTIGAIKGRLADMRSPAEMTEQEAWNAVRSAISNGLYGAKEEFEKLPATLQRLVGAADALREWAAMDSERLETVVASNFMRSYRARAASERERMMLPGDVKEFMGRLAERMGLPSGAKEMTPDEIGGRQEEIRRQLSKERGR